MTASNEDEQCHDAPGGGEYTWSSGSVLLAGACPCGDFSCEGDPCIYQAV